MKDTPCILLGCSNPWVYDHLCERHYAWVQEQREHFDNTDTSADLEAGEWEGPVTP